MPDPFVLARLPKIIFGAGMHRSLPGIAAEYGSEVVVITGARSFISSPYGGILFEQLKDRGLTIHHLTVAGEPSPALVDDAVSRLKGAGISLIAAIGGGSVMDAGKAISAMLTTDGSVTDYLEVVGSREHPGTKVPFIAVPTTSGTGSEATKNAVISQVGKEGFKRSLRHDNFVPDLVIIDPELTLECPPDITAAAGMDCFTQLAEAYLSDKGSPMTDALAIEGLKAVNRSLLRSFTNGDDIEARSDMSYAALMSGVCLANAGLGAVHGLAGTIGAFFDIPHGVVCGTLMAAANDMNVSELLKIIRHGSSTGDIAVTNANTALGKYSTLGRIFADATGKIDSYYIGFFIDFLRAITCRLNMPGLGSYGLVYSDLEAISSQSDVKNNPVRLSSSRLLEILEQRL